MEVFAQALTEFRRLRTRMRNTGHLRQIKRITTNEKKIQKKKKKLLWVFQQTSHIKTFKFLVFVKDLFKLIRAGKSF